MKKEKMLLTVLFLCLVLALSACAAGEKEAEVPLTESAPVHSTQTEAPEEEPAAEATGESAEASTEEQPPAVLGTWDGLTYALAGETLRCTDESGALQWEQPLGIAAIDQCIYISEAGMAESGLLFFAAEQKLGCVGADGTLYPASGASRVQGAVTALGHELFMNQYVTLTVQTQALSAPLRARFNTARMTWSWLDESGVAEDGSDLGTVFATAEDGLTELRAVSTPEGVSGLVVKDVRHKAGRYLGAFQGGLFLPDGDILAWTQDGLCSFAAADEYGQPLEWVVLQQGEVLLGVVYDEQADEALLAFAVGQTGERIYSIAHCRRGGRMERVVSTGISVSEGRLHFVFLQGGLLTVQADDSVNLTGERIAHFTYDTATSAVRDLSA